MRIGDVVRVNSDHPHYKEYPGIGVVVDDARDSSFYVVKFSDGSGYFYFHELDLVD